MMAVTVRRSVTGDSTGNSCRHSDFLIRVSLVDAEQILAFCSLSIPWFLKQHSMAARLVIGCDGLDQSFRLSAM